jgi:hypothetical protein
MSSDRESKSELNASDRIPAKKRDFRIYMDAWKMDSKSQPELGKELFGHPSSFLSKRGMPCLVGVDGTLKKKIRYTA